MIVQKSDDRSVKIEVNRFYFVPCFVYDRQDYEFSVVDYDKYNLDKAEWDACDIVPRKLVYLRNHKILPVINHPHHDKENGQDYVHWHIDFRFPITYGLTNKQITRINTTDKDFPKYTFEYVRLPCISTNHQRITPPKFIQKSKLKHTCIHKGKCPHRGYDLSNEPPNKLGIITCPLHGLKFDGISKQLLHANG